MAYVLIIDDDEDFAGAAAATLRTQGHEVAVELDVQDAMRSMEARVPDLAILDVMFPENSSAGFELARKLRQCEGELGSMPVLLLTALNSRFPLGFSSKDIDDEWMPVNAFLEKPVDLDVLCERVASLLAPGQEG